MSRPNPINRYGFTKWEGETVLTVLNVPYIIVRISKLFSKSMFEKYFNWPEPKVLPTFIWRNYTYLPYFATSLIKVANNHFDFPRQMKLHLGSSAPLDMCSFWRMIETEYGGDGHLISGRKDEDACYSPRPYNGVLSVKVAEEYGLEIPSTRKGIQEMLKEL